METSEAAGGRRHHRGGHMDHEHEHGGDGDEAQRMTRDVYDAIRCAELFHAIAQRRGESLEGRGAVVLSEHAWLYAEWLAEVDRSPLPRPDAPPSQPDGH